MCGLAGWAGAVAADEHVLRRMCEAVRHRGPDDDGAHVVPGEVALGFRRLSIIDLVTGSQPLFNERRTVAVTCNGEIYNFPELKDELRSRGHEFRTRSDVETIAHLYEERGPACLEELQGMFAIALWDAERKRLMLARDRLGVKPIYWARVDGGLLYGSEPGAILASGLVEPRVDPEAIVEYLTLQYVPPPRSGFAGIQKLAPGERLLYEDGEVTIERYWSLRHRTNGRPMDEAESLDELDELLRQATRSRLISDVPLGAFLSGGIDSSLVVGYMAEALPRVATFSIDVSDPRFGEGQYARRVAQLYGTDHEEFLVEPDMLPLLEEIVRHLGEPFADSSAIPTYLLSRMTRSRVTVALSGDGGDEAFAGYVRHQLATVADRLGPVPRAAARTARAVLPKAVMARLPRIDRGLDVLSRSAHDRYAAVMAHFEPDQLQQVAVPDFLAAAGGARRAWDGVLALPPLKGVNRYLALDTNTYLPGDVLAKVDRMSMAHSLEVRSPFLDYRVYELAARLPQGLKLRGRTTKYLLRQLARRRGVPDDLVDRKKRGFGVPIGEWFRGELRSWVEGVIRDPRTRGRGLFDPAAVDRLLDQHLGGSADHTYRIWNLVMLELWQRAWIDRA